MPDHSVTFTEGRAPAGWHAEDAARVLELVGSSPSGLSGGEAARRLREHGPNELEPDPPPSPLVLFLRQFRSPLIYILLLAAIVTAVLQEYIDTGVIAAVLLVNAAIGFFQERKAEGAVRALMQLVVPTARVLRDGLEQEVDSRQLVPGDVVLLDSGARVPADLRLLSVNGLIVDESLLTGESLTVVKQAGRLDAGLPVADRVNLAYSGTVVTSGRGRGVVVSTGADTELGKIAGLIRREQGAKTPLQQRMTRFSRVIGLAVLVGALLAFVVGTAVGQPLHEMFLTAVALAVAAIPEGLPVVLTIALALGVTRMARRNAIIRRLPAVEALGSASVIGSDKTGTLTENRMTVQRIWADGQVRDIGASAGDVARDALPRDATGLTLLAGVLSNEARAHRAGDELVVEGDPTEAALLLAARRAGSDPYAMRERWATVAEVPFEPERRYSASLRRSGPTQALFVKGAPERLLQMCTRIRIGERTEPLQPELVHRAADGLAREGLRVLGMAYREFPGGATPTQLPEEPAELVFLGLQGMLDPPRDGVAEAVAHCQRAGIRVVMITGDHAVTAVAIAARLGIAPPHEEALTGPALARLDDEQLRRRVHEVSVYARVSPQDKLRIVRALQAEGEAVAVTGDGVNDAPALKAAAIGVAMGREGTDVAREAADMVLADDNFVSIVAAIEEGRVTFDNIRKATFFLVSTGAATILAILATVAMDWPLLMLPAQLLWLNLVTNGLQDVALAFERGEKDVLDRPPRAAREGVLSPLLWQRTLLSGLVMAAGTLLLFRWELDAGGSLQQAQTVALTTMVVFMAFQAGNARSDHRSVFRVPPWHNPFLSAATLGALLLHAAALYLPPTQFVLRVEPIEAEAWLRLVVVAATILLAVELDKAVRRMLALRGATV